MIVSLLFSSLSHSHGSVLGNAKWWCQSSPLVQTWRINEMKSIISEGHFSDYLFRLMLVTFTWIFHFVWIKQPRTHASFSVVSENAVNHHNLFFFRPSPTKDDWITPQKKTAFNVEQTLIRRMRERWKELESTISVEEEKERNEILQILFRIIIIIIIELKHSRMITVSMLELHHYESPF